MAQPKREREIKKEKKVREKHCSPQMEDRFSLERKDSPRLTFSSFHASRPVNPPRILPGSHGDAPKKFAYKIFWHLLHTVASHPPARLILSLHFSSAIHLTSLGCITGFSFSSFLDAIATLLCTDRSLFVSSSLLFEFPKKPRLSDHREFCTAVRQVSRGAQTDHMLFTEQWRQSPSNGRSDVMILTIDAVTIKNDRDESDLDIAPITVRDLARKNYLLP